MSIKDLFKHKTDRSLTRDSVMILSAAVGAGHLRAADALLSAFNSRNIPAKHIEVLRYTNPIFKKLYSDLYIELVNKQPDILGWIYNALDRPWQHQKRRLALNRLNTVPLVKFLKSEKPKFIICTHFLPAEILAYLKRKKIISIPIGIVITDFDAHALWLYREVDWYFVACEETKVYLIEMGIPEKSIFVTGIPIDPVFLKTKSKKDERLYFGLDPDKPTILISLGGFGVGPVESVVNFIQKVQYPIQMIVVCGKNTALELRLNSLSGLRHSMKVIGFTKEMDRLMAASDILVGKAGGLTCSEALASGLIMSIVYPTPGQEERNSDHLLEEGAAIRCNNLPALAYKIDKLLNDKERMQRMKDTIKSLAKPDPASKIVSIIEKMTNDL